MLILDKPAGVLTQQAQRGDMSLNELMIGYLLDTGTITSQELRLFKPSVCNRLDRNTSGLVLCGKSLPGSQALSELIRSRGVRKFYNTLCVGLMETPHSGVPIEIQGYLQKDSRTNRVIIRQKRYGEYIRTAYRPIKSYCIPLEFWERTQKEYVALSKLEVCFFTKLEVELITGKPHQIRAHLASISHPLVGDGKYGNAHINQLFHQYFGLCWQLLHACRLEFPTLEGVLAPLSGRNLQSPTPEKYKLILEEMEPFSQKI